MSLWQSHAISWLVCLQEKKHIHELQKLSETEVSTLFYEMYGRLIAKIFQLVFYTETYLSAVL
jgi:hypothetical protein